MKMRFLLLICMLLGQVYAQTVTVSQLNVPGEDYFDPEIHSDEDAMVWMDGNRTLWYADLDSNTGFFIQNVGKQIVVDTSAPLLATWNAGEFLIDSQGWRIVYSKTALNSTVQIHEAILNAGSFQTNQLTVGNKSNAGVIPSRSASYPSGKLLFFRGNINNQPDLNWSDRTTPNLLNPIGTYEKGFTHGDFFQGSEFGLLYSHPDSSGVYQLYIADSLNQITQITFSPSHKQNPMTLEAPELGGTLILACIAEHTTGDSLLFFQKIAGNWNRLTALGLPSGTSKPRFSSSEMFAFQGRTMVSVQIEDTTGGGVQDAEIWLLSMDGALALRVDDQLGAAQRTDPEYYVTDQKAFVYYNIYRNNIWEMWVSEVSGWAIESR
jgi:hypothetical protein